jgi:beta-1,2-mannobiose phosphorylase / 1,2-beta-oligomannan phosphorylase
MRDDRLAFTPHDVDLARSPLRSTLQADTFVLGAFNPGLTRLANGNLLMMVRVAEALRDAIDAQAARAIRWSAHEGYVIDVHPAAGVNAADPRKFMLTQHHAKTMALTSLSWLLPVELDAEGVRILTVHYDRAIAPEASFQEYGVEDARISRIDGRYYMTTCSVSAERHSTTLYTSDNGLDYRLEGIVLDHQNKDMLFYEGRVADKFWAMTRPLGDLYFAYPPDSDFLPGPAIQLASSPDALHWKPWDGPLIRPRKGARANQRMGGGAPPILTDDGWLALYHGVEARGLIGVYRTFWALLAADAPWRVLRLEDHHALMEANPALTAPLDDLMYVRDVVFTTGIAAADGGFLVASGEADLACRLTWIDKRAFG